MYNKAYDFEKAAKSIKKGYETEMNVNCEAKTERPSKQKLRAVPFKKLYRFTNGYDILIIVLMILSSVGVGVAFPINILIFKDVVNILVSPTKVPSYSTALHTLIINFAIIASATFICGFVQILCVSKTAECQGRRYKHRYFSALLRQDISWFDQQPTGQLLTKITDGVEYIEVAIADRMSEFVQNVSSFSVSIIIAMIGGWKLTLVGCLAVPLLCISFFCMIHFLKKYAIEQNKAYTVAGGVAEEILSGIRTVVAFNAQEKEVVRYSSNLGKAEMYGIKKALAQGLATGAIGASVFSTASLVFYLGIRLVATPPPDQYYPGMVVQIFLTIIIGSVALGNAVPSIESFMTAKASAYPLFEVIDRKPSINTLDPGIIPVTSFGDIVFKNIDFEYPTRPGVKVLKNFNFTIPRGKTVAFIGPSGSGKSTIINLLQRFYDPVSGTVSVSDIDLRDIDLNWYRSCIGLVQQEPPLFSGTIEDNIRLGKESASFEEIIEATKDSNAYDFIMQTKEKFKTKLGDLGAGFSGGQKQRLAIATALVRKPKLLLLDEATSALDNMSEKLVQSTLDKAMVSKNRTIVMVAHRLQTVRNADIIVVMKNGEIVEQGNHDALFKEGGVYYEMLKLQKGKDSSMEEQLTPNSVIENETIKDELQHRISINSISDGDVSETKISKFQFSKDFIRIMRLNKPEAFALTIGVIASFIVGATYPGGALIYAEMFEVFSLQNNTKMMIEEGNIYCGLMLLPACVLLFSQFLKIACLGKAGEALTKRIRTKLMEAMLKQEMAWFDLPENIPGVLTARLALEATLVKGVTGIQLSVYIEVFANVITCLAIGFYFSWMLTLLFFIFLPFITFAGIMQGKISSNQRLTNNESTNSSASTMEILNNIRTVQSLGLQEHFSDQFLHSLRSVRRGKAYKSFFNGLMSGISTSALYYSYCVIFLVGAVLIDRGQITMIQLMRVFASLSIGSAALGRALALAPDAEKARQAARRTLETLDRESKISVSATVGITPATKLSGKIEFKNVSFRYPSRLNVSVLKGLDLEINAGQTVALVGHSGCGKSTVIQLLERYYDPTSLASSRGGQILLDGHDLRSLNLQWVRDQMGLVKQEPSLFNMSVLENIAYGKVGDVKIEDIVKVAKMANIHNFISELPMGYNTKVGQRGGHLSGGQKQRICIARALYNKPAILLLDEATSALDTDSEKVVQEALDRAQENCTCIIIAHRLSTIQNADKIVVIENGMVKETGTHGALMARKEIYYDLNTQCIN